MFLIINRKPPHFHNPKSCKHTNWHDCMACQGTPCTFLQKMFLLCLVNIKLHIWVQQNPFGTFIMELLIVSQLLLHPSSFYDNMRITFFTSIGRSEPRLIFKWFPSSSIIPMFIWGGKNIQLQGVHDLPSQNVWWRMKK